MHRSLSLDCILMSRHDQALEVSSIQDFDTSYHLHSRWMVKQGFLIDGYMLPPEVESGEAQDCRVDTWSLGQILYQLLCEPSRSNPVRLQRLNEEAHWLPEVSEDVRALAQAMTDPDLEKRPSI